MTDTFDWTRVVDYSKRVQIDPPLTQYELPGITEELHDGVRVAVVPLWHAIVTARLAFGPEDGATLSCCATAVGQRAVRDRVRLPTSTEWHIHSGRLRRSVFPSEVP